MDGEIPEEEFENMDWYVRLVLEGEDHLGDNADRRYYYHTVSYSAVAEDWKELSDASASVEDFFLEEEEREEAARSLDVLTVKQRHVVTEHFYNEMPYIRIAENLGVTRQAVRDMMGKAMNQMRKHLAEDANGALA
ncbi:MAG: sigma-70 family RNA polymerase sigma factor [Clostridiales bacterium]|nr:sigma-70 family RNA polymerase sigma factor [Clostridiales bacterium]